MKARLYAAAFLVVALLATAIWGLVDIIGRDATTPETMARQQTNESGLDEQFDENEGDENEGDENEGDENEKELRARDVNPGAVGEPRKKAPQTKAPDPEQGQSHTGPRVTPVDADDAALAADVHGHAERLRAFRFDFSSEAAVQSSMLGYASMIQDMKPLAKRLSASSNPSLQVEGWAVLGESYQRMSAELARVPAPERLSQRQQEEYRTRLNAMRADFDAQAKQMLEAAVAVGRRENLDSLSFRKAQQMLESLSKP